MLNRSHVLALCALMVLVTACGQRTESRTAHEVRTSQTFYPRNEGCTFDGVAGTVADISQMHKAKENSDACFIEPKQPTTISHSIRNVYTANPGCTIDGVPAATASSEQLMRSEAFSEECFSPPSAQK
jgi:hypothetical protein